MDVNIVCIGKLKESYWRDACAEYAKRLSPYCKFTITELAEARLPKSPSSGEIERALEEEGARILDKCGTAFVIAMCIEGDVLSSEQFASHIASAALHGKSSVAVIIGGSHGLSPAVKKRADLRMSMGRMTFPHQLARVMLCEQLYRAFSINNG
ncbi:MAG: 23S rRNA (pseudouridine(1915)-N(3))-methyltransferase RlmH, partial [Clostridia bacterium]|nr:23S rRNA (pseudouridine(1915)-N(3))-methyltransferase RlmH [Clostridia bacterium]